MKIISMLLAVLLATDVTAAQAQNGSEHSWQHDAESCATWKKLRKRRLRKQQLGAQAQKADRNKCAECKDGND